MLLERLRVVDRAPERAVRREPDVERVQPLSEAGYAPLVTGTPRDLPRIIRTEKPRLVLLDLVLPEVDGITPMATCSRLAQTRRSVSKLTTRPALRERARSSSYSVAVSSSGGAAQRHPALPVVDGEGPDHERLGLLAAPEGQPDPGDELDRREGLGAAEPHDRSERPPDTVADGWKPQALGQAPPFRSRCARSRRP